MCASIVCVILRVKRKSSTSLGIRTKLSSLVDESACLLAYGGVATISEPLERIVLGRAG